jgi:hypothetical protein
MPHHNIRCRTNSIFYPYEGETRVRQTSVRLCHTTTLDVGPIVSIGPRSNVVVWHSLTLVCLTLVSPS